ncbi:hypothetical protein, unknown function [Leishmania tarentolae]|uniref:Uncharacterized protein n=1 Tax=Leishmania tarentolae TaxID=5689 RepID=A0A640KAE4_LEITA|nr:hypothetical protein, unknown function [Leishmania tarentolae]
MSDKQTTETEVRSSVIDGAAGVLPSSPHQPAAGLRTGDHIARIFRALQQLQPRRSRLPASSSKFSNSSTFEDGAAAWMCSHLDLLWESMGSSATATPSTHANAVSASTPTHPRTRLILQLLALETLRREKRRDIFPPRSPLRSHVSTDASLLKDTGVSVTSSRLPAPIACSSVHLGPSCHHDTHFGEGDSSVVHQWLWQRAAALPARMAVPGSPSDDLSALMMEWAALALPAWRESFEEARWRHERDAMLRLMHEIATAATACSFVKPEKEAREVEETTTTVPDLVQESGTSTIDTVVPNRTGGLSSNQAMLMPQAKDFNEDILKPSLTAVPGPLLASAADGAPSSPPRRVLQLAVSAAVNAATAQQADPTTVKGGAVAPLPTPAASKEEALVEETEETPAWECGDTASAFPMTPPLHSQTVDTPAMSSENTTANDDNDVGVNKRLTIQLFHTTGGIAAPRGAAETATTSVSAPPCSTAVEGVKAKVTARPPMLLSDEDATGDDGELQRSMATANNSAQDANAPVSPVSEATGNTAACMRSRLRRWRRIAPAVLDAPPGSEAAQNVCTVLEALGFAPAGEGECGDKVLTELTPSCGPAQVPEELPKDLKVPASSRFSEGAARSRMPLCPLGRLPPLLAAHAWLSETLLRSSWLAYIIAAPTSECSLAVGDDGSELCLKCDVTALVSSRDPQVTPLSVQASSSSSSAHCSGDALPHLQLPEAPPAMPCTALADHRVFSMLGELLWCVYPSSSAFLLSFEEKLHRYLCYPLAGVCAATLATATATKPTQCQGHCHLEQAERPGRGHDTSAPHRLSLPAWKAYLELRYGKTQPRQPTLLPPSPLKTVPAPKTATSNSETDDHAEPDVAAAACSTAGGSHHTKKRRTRGHTAEDQEMIPQPAMSPFTACAAVGTRTPLLPFVTASFAASSSATASTATYAAVMDVAAMVFLAELRRVGAIAMAEKAKGAAQALQACDARCRAGLLYKLPQKRSGESGGSAESRVCVASTADVENVRQFSPAAADASCFKDAPGRCGISGSSLQALLEGTVECDAALHRYVYRWPEPLSLAFAAAKGTRVQETPRDSNIGEHSVVDVATHLWLALVTVLSLGESATAQYVRGVLMPPSSLPAMPCPPSPTSAESSKAAAQAVDVPSSAVRTSLAPFTMPTLFQSTLEDLYQEESAATAAAVAMSTEDHAPTCRPSSLPFCAANFLGDEKDPTSKAVSTCRAAPASLATATLQTSVLMTPAAQDTLVLSAAVALRHPRVVLRQLHFLWHLSNCENRDGCATKADDSSHRSETLSSPKPAPLDTGRTAASPQRATGGTDRRATAKNTSNNPTVSFKQEFTTRVASLIECIQLASLAGLPPPLATSLTPFRSSSSAVPAEAGGSALNRDAPVSSMRQAPTEPSTWAANASAAVTPFQQQRSTVAFPAPALPPAPDSGGTVIAQATPMRLRLQLLSKTTYAGSLTAGVGATKVPTTDSAKRSREPREVAEMEGGIAKPAVLSISHDVAVESLRPAKWHRVDGVETQPVRRRSPSGERAPPPLKSLLEWRVRWADEGQERNGSVRLSLTPLAATSSGVTSNSAATTSKAALLLDVVTDPLWDALQHIHAQVLGGAVGSAHVLPGNGPASVNDPAAATSALSPAHLRDAEATPGGVPVRRTLLRLCVSPAYRSLQRLWQAISHPTLSQRGMVVSSEAGTLSPTGGAAASHPRLDVVFSATASPREPAVDLRDYASLTASLRGVVCIVLGYAVYQCLRGIWRNWCVLCNVHEDLATVAACTTAPSGSAQQLSCMPFSPSHRSYVWLTGKLRALLEDVLQPLNRILKVSLSGVDGNELFDDRRASEVERGDGHAVAELRSPALQKPVPTHAGAITTATWLTYNPLGLVLIPALIRQLDAAMLWCMHNDCAGMSGGLHCQDAYEAWGQVKAALQKAGVQA